MKSILLRIYRKNSALMRNVSNRVEMALSDSELLAVILRSGTQGKNSLALAQEILHYMEDSAYCGTGRTFHISRCRI